MYQLLFVLLCLCLSSAALAAPSWEQMSKKERDRYMEKVVNPKMKALFQAYDRQEFAKFGCSSCHGKNAKAKKYEMPNPGLPVLPDTEEEFMATVMKKKPEAVKFMGEKVVPLMAELLGKPAFDPKAPRPDAFSCEGCHTLKGDAHHRAADGGTAHDVSTSHDGGAHTDERADAGR